MFIHDVKGEEMRINWTRVSIGASLFIGSVITALYHNKTLSIDATAIISLMTFCFSFLILALSVSHKEVK